MAKLIMDVHQADTNQTWVYELGDASVMTDLMRGILPAANYYCEAPLVGSVRFSFKVEPDEAQEVSEREIEIARRDAMQATLDEAEQSERDHIPATTDESGDEYDDLENDPYEEEIL